MRAALAALLVVAVLAGGVLAWGYWRTVTHGTLHVLASTSADPQFGVFTIRHPTAGDCRREEREATRDTAGMAAWNRCFETQSRWLMTWVRRARSAA